MTSLLEMAKPSPVLQYAQAFFLNDIQGTTSTSLSGKANCPSEITEARPQQDVQYTLWGPLVI